MTIGIIVYSETGNTLTVARTLEQQLSSQGHPVTLEQLQVTSNPRSKDQLQLASRPNLEEYERLIMGSPVHAFSLSPAMTAFLQQIPSLDQKPTIAFVTQFFPFAWMGGNRALRQMTTLCKERSGRLLASAVINWSHPRRDPNISKIVERLSQKIIQ